jgi:hypothetical protein
MSSWMTGKIDLKCSIDVLQKILLGVMPKWKDRIKIDPEGELLVNNKKCHIVIKAKRDGLNYGGIVGDNYSDIGFTKDKESRWSVTKMDFYFPLEESLKRELAIEKVKAQARLQKAKLVEEEDIGGKRRMVLHIPS